jgi:ubiquitin C-terminal hydrolase
MFFVLARGALAKVTNREGTDKEESKAMYQTSNGQYGEFSKNKNSDDSGNSNNGKSPMLPRKKDEKSNGVDNRNGTYISKNGRGGSPSRAVRGIEIWPLGLPNIGNTCYLNAITQCVLSTRPFMQYFVSGDYLIGNKESQFNIASYLTKLYASSRLGEAPNDSMKDLLDDFKSSIQTVAKRYGGYSQHDAHEFLRDLLDGLHNEVNKSTSKTSTRYCPSTGKELKTLLTEFEQAAKVKDDSIITDVFGGVTIDRIECTKCRNVSLAVERTLDVSLPLKKLTKSFWSSEAMELSDCLNEYVKEEACEEYECEKCKKKFKCLKQISFLKAPEVLVIHLKRFEYDKSSGKKEKIEEKIKFPVRNLNFSPYVHEQLRGQQSYYYNLFGIVNHSGSLSGGHYQARCCDETFSSWNNFNDDTVKEISIDTINDYKTKGSDSPYILFYKRIGQ